MGADAIRSAVERLFVNGGGRQYAYLVLRDTPGNQPGEGGSYSPPGLERTLRDALGSPRRDLVPAGCAPKGNRASVEIVPTGQLKADDVVWCEDRWHVVLEHEGNDDGGVLLAPIIDDAGGQGDRVCACAEFFLRVERSAP